MTHDASDGDDGGEAERVFLLDTERVRREFRATSYEVWIAFASLTGRRWESPAIAHAMAGKLVATLGDLAKLRCAPDGRSLPASEVFDCLLTDVSRDGKTPQSVVERHLVRTLAGKPRSERTTAEVVGLAEAFFRCFAADCERGELTWIDELHTLVSGDGPDASWTLEVPRADGASGDGAAVALRIPLAALEAAGLLAGDRLVLEPRIGGLWIGRAP